MAVRSFKPERAYTVLGGTSTTALDHLSDAEAAALPLTGLTAWRALSTKSNNAEPGRNILVTGIGGGAALMMLLFAVARRCNVFMTSFFAEKIDRAKSLGAKDGVIFTDEEGWPKTLRKLLPKDPPFLDAVIDGAGGDTVGSTWKLLKLGGVVVIYGKTSMGQPSMPMQAVMKNIELKGSTMDSRRDFGEMVRFVSESNIRPVVERVVHGLDNLEGIEGLFENLKEGGHFGKVVVKIDPDGKGDQGRPNL